MNLTTFLFIGIGVLLVYLLFKHKLKIITAVIIFAVIIAGTTFINPSIIKTFGNFLIEKGITIPSFNSNSIEEVKNLITNNPAENQRVEIQEQEKQQDTQQNIKDNKIQDLNTNIEKNKEIEQEKKESSIEKPKNYETQINEEPQQDKDQEKNRIIDNSLLDQLKRLLELYERLLKDKNSLDVQLDDLRKQIEELRKQIENQQLTP